MTTINMKPIIDLIDAADQHAAILERAAVGDATDAGYNATMVEAKKWRDAAENARLAIGLENHA